MKISAALWAVASLLVSNASFAEGDAERGLTKASTCVACHGVGGHSVVPTFPKLAGQGEVYLLKQLKDYATGVRKGPVMSGIAAQLTEQDRADLAAYYANETRSVVKVSEVDNASGSQLYLAGNKEAGIPACMACHGPNGAGIPSAGWPAVAGQHTSYTEKTLADFASGERANDHNEVMRDIAMKMSAEDIKAVSHYIQDVLH